MVELSDALWVVDVADSVPTISYSSCLQAPPGIGKGEVASVVSSGPLFVSQNGFLAAESVSVTFF